MKRVLISKNPFLLKTEFYCYIYTTYQWRAVDFQPADAVQIRTLHFFKFHFILRSFLQNLSIIASYNLSLFFSNLTLDFLTIDIETDRIIYIHFSFFWRCFNSFHSWKLTDALVDGIMQIKYIKSRIKINFCSLCFKKMSKTRRKIFFNYDFFLFECLNSDTHDSPRKKSQKVRLYQYIVLIRF